MYRRLMPWLLVLLAVGATVRLTLLVTTDRIAQTFRRKVAGWSPVEGDATWEGTGEDIDLGHVDLADRPKVAYLVKCDWCSSFWLAWAPSTVAVLWPDNRAVWAALTALTASLVAGLVSTAMSVAFAARDRLDAPCS